MSTSSIRFPNMFNVARNQVATLSDNPSIVNRTRLLMLTEPTELYRNPTFGVGLKRYLWQYNNANTKAIIQDKIREQLREHEPCVDADQTVFADGLVSSASTSPTNSYVEANQLKMTVGLYTRLGDVVNLVLDIDEERKRLFGELPA